MGNMATARFTPHHASIIVHNSRPQRKNIEIHQHYAGETRRRNIHHPFRCPPLGWGKGRPPRRQPKLSFNAVDAAAI